MDVVALTLVGKVTGGVALLRSVDDAERDDQGQGHLQAGDVRDLEQNRADTSLKRGCDIWRSCSFE